MAATIKPTQAELRERFDYESLIGHLVTKERGSGRSHRRAGKIAGHLRTDGYVHVQVGDHSYYAHCIIWCWMKGEWPTFEVDHEDLNRGNNKWLNLRAATSSQNAFARGNENPDRGIEVLPNGKYRPRIGFQGSSLHLGCFNDIDQARSVRHQASKKLFGDFVR